MGGAVVAAAAAQAKRRVISHFMARDAMSADKAVPFDTNRHMEQRFFDRLRDRGVIRPGASGGYYLHAPSYDAFQHTRSKRVKVLLLGVIALLLVGAVVGILRLQ